MGADEERVETGRRMWREVTGMEPPATGSPAITVSLVPQVFGEIWSRPGLTRKERRWMSLTATAALGVEQAIEAHARGALSSGDITFAELEEWVLHMTAYIGWPRASLLETTMRRIAAEQQP